MGDRRADVAALGRATPTESDRGWPIVVRRARTGDRDAILAFSSRTWDGWDYIPHAWPVWLDAADGVLLVAEVGPPAHNAAAADADGQPLPMGAPIAISRVALLSTDEGWVEGIRVDPRVRGLGVATDLQVAELHWLAVHEVRVTRYATSVRNEGSHRLGARHGFELLARYQSWFWRDPNEAAGSTDRGPSAFDEPVLLDANRRRRALLDRLDAEGLTGPGSIAGEWWARLASDEAFTRVGRLYEQRSWTMQELTERAFARHLEAGEVVGFADNGWALAIISREAQPAEDATIHLGVIAGETRAIAALATKIQRAAGERIRFRLEVGGMTDELAALLGDAGFAAWPWELHILGRLGPAEPPAIDPARLVLGEGPDRILRAPVELG